MVAWVVPPAEAAAQPLRRSTKDPKLCTVRCVHVQVQEFRLSALPTDQSVIEKRCEWLEHFVSETHLMGLVRATSRLLHSICLT